MYIDMQGARSTPCQPSTTCMACDCVCRTIMIASRATLTTSRQQVGVPFAPTAVTYRGAMRLNRRTWSTICFQSRPIISENDAGVTMHSRSWASVIPNSACAVAFAVMCQAPSACEISIIGIGTSRDGTRRDPSCPPDSAGAGRRSRALNSNSQTDVARRPVAFAGTATSGALFGQPSCRAGPMLV